MFSKNLGRRLSWVVFLSMLAFCNISAEEKNDSPAVSMVNLISAPEKYVNSRVTTFGYFDVDIPAIYLGESWAKAYDQTSAIHFSDSYEFLWDSKCDDIYVSAEIKLIDGVYDFVSVDQIYPSVSDGVCKTIKKNK